MYILNDSLCELSPTEFFSSFLEYESGETTIIISPDRARIKINDTCDCVPDVTLTAPSGLLYEVTSQTLTCTATLHLPVNSDIAISIHWTTATNSDRVIISSPSSERCPFISILTLSPLVMSDAGLYSCEATVYSLAQNTTDNITQHSQELNLKVTALPAPDMTVSHSGLSIAGQRYSIHCSAEVPSALVALPNMMIIFPNSTIISLLNTIVVEHVFSQLTLSDSGPYTCLATVNIPQANITNLTATHTENLTIVQFAYPVEKFKGKLSASQISFIFTWTPPSIGAELTTQYDLTCLPLLKGIPMPRVLFLSNTETSAEMSGLYSGVTYNCSIFTVTTEGSSLPKNLTLSTQEKAPSGAPEMFEAVPGERVVVFSLSSPPITEQNGPLTSYTLSCSPSLPSQPFTIPPESRPSLTVNGLSPNTDYTCCVTADNSRGSGPPENFTFTTMEDFKYFQLRLSGLLTTCSDLVSNDRSLKVEQITREVIEKVAALCPECGFTDASIDKQSFSCYSQSPSFVTYRARLEGTSQTDSDHFISLIEQWVMGGASVIVTEVLLKVDSKCSVEISDLSEDECIMEPAPAQTFGPSPTNNSKGQDSLLLPTILTVIGVIMIVIVVIAATTIAVLVLRNCQARYNLKNSTKISMEAKGGTPQTTGNKACEELKLETGGDSEESYEMMVIIPTVNTPTKISPISTPCMYEVPSPSQPLPAVPPPSETDKKEDECNLYEVIPGDK